jgi:hypothetical protein
VPTEHSTSVLETNAFPTTKNTLYLSYERQTLTDKSLSGGPPKDGIPSIDNPQFESADAVGDRLADGDIVFGIVQDGVAKAYPQIILASHEIVNDTIAEQPIAVTYCPLTGTVLGFKRGKTTFGVSGRLINNNLVMYDRATQAWWPQMLATSIPGPWNTTPEPASLQEIRLIWTTWKRWRNAYPDTRVLTEDTGYARNYNRDPYGSYNPRKGYYKDDSTLFPPLDTSDRFKMKDIVIGARTTSGAAAFYKPSLRKQGVLEGQIADTPIVAVYDPKLDTGYVYRGSKEGVKNTDGAITVNGDQYSPANLPLERIMAYDAMWFAWYGYYPDGNVYS